MTAEDILALAQKLAAGKTEAEARSGVSRVYYAVFHAAQRLVEKCGVKLPKSAAAHEKLMYCLQQSGHARLDEIGVDLSALRGYRNTADYRLDDPQFRDAVFVRRIMDVAVDSFRDLVAASTDTTSYRERIREYARKTLGLIVTD